MSITEENMTTIITLKPDPKAFAKAYAEFIKKNHSWVLEEETETEYMFDEHIDMLIDRIRGYD